MIKITKLKSGLRVLTIPQQNTRTVTVLVLVGTGSKYEEKRVNGISHFLEHMFFKGTKKRSTPFKIAGPIENAGGGSLMRLHPKILRGITLKLMLRILIWHWKLLQISF